MTPKRVYFVILGAILLLVGLSVAGTYTARNLIIAEGEKLTELKLEKEVLDKQTAALDQANKDISEYEGLELIARSVVPQDKDQARTVLELVTMAEMNGIRITSIAFPDSLLGQISKGKAKKGTSTDPNLTQLTPLDNPKGVYSMEIRIDTDQQRTISFDQLVSFLEMLENNCRTAQVTNISITPDTANRNRINFTLTLTSYVKP